MHSLRGKEDFAGATGYRYVRIDLKSNTYWLSIPGFDRETFTSLDGALQRRHQLTQISGFPTRESRPFDWVILDLDFGNNESKFGLLAPDVEDYPIKFKASPKIQEPYVPAKKRLRMEDSATEVKIGPFVYIWDGLFKGNRAPVGDSVICPPNITDMWSAVAAMLIQKHQISAIEKWRTLMLIQNMTAAQLQQLCTSFLNYFSKYPRKEFEAVIRQLIDVALIHPENIDDSVWFARVFALVSPVSPAELTKIAPTAAPVVSAIVEFCFAVRVKLDQSVVQNVYNRIFELLKPAS